jgi:hypothetical protein
LIEKYRIPKIFSFPFAEGTPHSKICFPFILWEEYRIQKKILFRPVSTDDRSAGLNGWVDGICGTGNVQPVCNALKKTKTITLLNLTLQNRSAF